MKRFRVFKVPFDKSVISRPGARFAPDRIVHYLGKLHLNVDYTVEEPKEDFNQYDVARAHTMIEEWIKGSITEETFPVFIGGDHSITFPLFKAMKERLYPDEEIYILNIDAHFDIREWEPDRITSGTPFRRILDYNLIEGKQIIEIGIRAFSNSPKLKEDARRFGIIWYSLDEVKENLKDILQKVKGIIGNSPLYFTFDMDVMESGCCPGSSAAHPYGLTFVEGLQIVDFVSKELNPIALDIVEVSPPWDRENNTSKAAAYYLGRFMHNLTLV